MLDKVTVVIKAFERPEELNTLLKGLRCKYPRLRIHVCDDGRSPTKNPFADETIILPFDSGISAGRNALLKSVTTPYFILMDDDFIVYEETCLERLIELMEISGLNLIGGAVHEPPVYEKFQCCHIQQKVNVLIRRKVKQSELRDGVLRCDMVRNFFIASTKDVIRTGGWDEELKQGEHIPFFLHIYGKLSVGYTPEVGVLHKKGVGSMFYQKYRARGQSMLEDYLKRYYGITETQWAA
jgi:GT2 family glycosyltransferase